MSFRYEPESVRTTRLRHLPSRAGLTMDAAGVATPMIEAPFPWFGGKRRVAPVIWRAFGDVRNYVEPFFAVLCSMRHHVKFDAAALLVLTILAGTFGIGAIMPARANHYPIHSGAHTIAGSPTRSYYWDGLTKFGNAYRGIAGVVIVNGFSSDKDSVKNAVSIWDISNRHFTSSAADSLFWSQNTGRVAVSAVIERIGTMIAKYRKPQTGSWIVPAICPIGIGIDDNLLCRGIGVGLKLYAREVNERLLSKAHFVQLPAYGDQLAGRILVGAFQDEPLQHRSADREKANDDEQPRRSNQPTSYRYEWGLVGIMIIGLGAALLRLAMELFYKADKAARFSVAAWGAFALSGVLIVHGFIYACMGAAGLRVLYIL